ncbi:molecular chaperone [Serratia sp. S1B]|nr:molecular chaperone [Serratia sp. S1B]
MKKIRNVLVVLWVVVWGGYPSLGAADGLKLPQTRVIFHAGNKSTTAGIQNLSQIPYLVKAEVVNLPGQLEQQAIPFLVTPPLFRLEPQEQFRVRILPQAKTNLPTDRESVFYLSFLAIPSTSQPGQAADTAVTARLSVGIQPLIKLFYRPAALPMTAREAQSKLVFHAYRDEVVMENPTPYYLTLNTLKLKGQNIDLAQTGAMIAPFSKKTYPVMGKTANATYTVINDYGAVTQPYQQTLSVVESRP